MIIDKQNNEEVPGDGMDPGVLAPIPIERLREMGRAMGHAVPKRILNLYLGDAPTRLAHLRESFRNGDAVGIENAAHSLKGSSANLGALAFAELCDEIESRCRFAVEPETEERLAALEVEFSRVEDAMRELLTEFD